MSENKNPALTDDFPVPTEGEGALERKMEEGR